MYNQQNSADNPLNRAAGLQGQQQRAGFKSAFGPIKVQRHVTQSAIRQIKSGAAPSQSAQEKHSLSGSKFPLQGRSQFIKSSLQARAGAKSAAAQPPPAPAANTKLEAAAHLMACVTTELDVNVRQPLSDLVSYAAALQAGIENEEERVATIETIFEGLRYLGRNLDDILDIAGSHGSTKSEDLPPFDMFELANEVAAVFYDRAAENGVALSVCIGDIPLLKANFHRMRIILMALVDNAVKYTKSGRIGVIAEYKGDVLQLTVEDTGYGIAVPTQQQISDESLSGKWSGDRPTGFAIIGQMVLGMGGDVAIRSTPGIGTVVTVTFPNIKCDSASSARRLTSWQRIGTMRIRDHQRLSTAAKILLIDASPIHNAIMEGMVRSLGFMNTVTLNGGTDALMQLMTGTVEVVFTDIAIPQMDGRTLIGEIRKIPAFKDIRVYAVTADESIAEDCDRLGFDGYILKPITPAKLRAALK